MTLVHARALFGIEKISSSLSTSSKNLKVVSKSFKSILSVFQQLRSFKLEVTVASSYHPKIIGRKGQVIQKIRMDHAVQIQFPPVDTTESDADKIVLTGYEHNCEAAKEAILKIVKDLVRISSVFIITILSFMPRKLELLAIYTKLCALKENYTI